MAAPTQAPAACRSNPSRRGGASRAVHTAQSLDRDIAAGACATKPPGARGSSARTPQPASRARVTLTVRDMRILDRYIVREIFRHAFLGLVVFTFVFFVPQLVRLMALFVRHSGSGEQILKLFLCIFPGVFTFTIPMAVLLSALLWRRRLSPAPQSNCFN